MVTLKGTTSLILLKKREGKLVKHVLETYEGECDGIYFFGNLSALDRLFIWGDKLKSIEKEKLYFPTFSHA